MQKIGIRREDKHPFERRVPLTPTDLRKLIEKHALVFLVEPSHRRVFIDHEYQTQGVTVQKDLSSCAIILGVKEIPSDKLLPEKVYLFFSHTIKGQAKNMPLLQQIIDLGCTLIDYERIVDDRGARMIFFGRHAGLAGMIDCFWALGQRLLYEGIETPFATIEQAYHYSELDQAKAEICRIGEELKRKQLPIEISPLTFGIVGYGNVAKGAQEILDLLGPQNISPADLLHLPAADRGIYKIVFKEEHTVKPLEGQFNLAEFFQHPQQYRSCFEPYLSCLSVLINCVYWEPGYPRLVTKNQLRKLYRQGLAKLKIIDDISCDIEGSIEATLRATEIDNPVYVFDVDNLQAIDGIEGQGPVILAVDNLPAELPKAASEWFSRALCPFIPDLAKADFHGSFEDCQLPSPLKRAMIVYRGQLTPSYEYLNDYL